MLRSHPDRELCQHISEVRSAAETVLLSHPSLPKRLDADRILEMVTLHDLGKLCRAFQEYIEDPLQWEGNQLDKAHSPLGFVLANTLWQRTGSVDTQWMVAACLSILGHHGGFPDRDTALNILETDDWVNRLTKQSEDYPWDLAASLISVPKQSLIVEDMRRTLDDLYDFWMQLFMDLDKAVRLDVQSVVNARLMASFCFSVLLEADRAFLMLSQRARELYTSSRQRPGFCVSMVDRYLERLSKDQQPDIDTTRAQARSYALQTMQTCPNSNLFTLTLPTGLGKTLTAATLAFHIWEQGARKIIVVLPYLSIIDQTADVYSELLQGPASSVLMQSHSLSVRDYDDLEGKESEFMLDTWQSSIVLTTFDQFLLAAIGSDTKHLIRTHNLANAVVILDEVQAMPTHLWDITSRVVRGLTESQGTTFIAMSATQPGFIEGATELCANRHALYSALNRYRLVLRHADRITIDDLADELLDRQEEFRSRRLMVTLNTRTAARSLFGKIAQHWNSDAYFLSADVVPKDRLALIKELKDRSGACLVVSTQVVEAGVDIDMDHVIRDFAPLDSIVQVAGRCNRHGLRDQATVEVINLTEEGLDRDWAFARRVYRGRNGGPDVSLQETATILGEVFEVPESEVLALCDDYYRRLREKKHLGADITREWAALERSLPVSTLLRGDAHNQVSFVVGERDDETELKALLKAALGEEDRWEKRRKLRQLAPRLASVTVTAWTRPGFDPCLVADQVGPYYFIRPGYYRGRYGLVLKGDVDNQF